LIFRGTGSEIEISEKGIYEKEEEESHGFFIPMAVYFSLIEAFWHCFLISGCGVVKLNCHNFIPADCFLFSPFQEKYISNLFF